ncbi:MAG: hypothetical protein Q7S79_03770 [bacterium]|nr:hypothetical protein [bacterium]
MIEGLARLDTVQNEVRVKPQVDQCDKASRAKNELPSLHPILTQHGSFANNTTIPMDEKIKIVLSEPEPWQYEDRMQLRKEMALYFELKRKGEIPEIENWEYYENVCQRMEKADLRSWELPISEQRLNKGRLSKSERNFAGRSPRRPFKSQRSYSHEQK